MSSLFAFVPVMRRIYDVYGNFHFSRIYPYVDQTFRLEFAQE